MMNELIQNKKVPTAIFAASDPIAIGALRALTQNGYQVPQDVSIIAKTPCKMQSVEKI